MVRLGPLQLFSVYAHPLINTKHFGSFSMFPSLSQKLESPVNSRAHTPDDGPCLHHTVQELQCHRVTGHQICTVTNSYHLNHLCNGNRGTRLHGIPGRAFLSMASRREMGTAQAQIPHTTILSHASGRFINDNFSTYG